MDRKSAISCHKKLNYLYTVGNDIFLLSNGVLRFEIDIKMTKLRFFQLMKAPQKGVQILGMYEKI